MTKIPPPSLLQATAVAPATAAAAAAAPRATSHRSRRQSRRRSRRHRRYCFRHHRRQSRRRRAAVVYLIAISSVIPPAAIVHPTGFLAEGVCLWGAGAEDYIHPTLNYVSHPVLTGPWLKRPKRPTAYCDLARRALTALNSVNRRGIHFTARALS